MKAQDLVQLAYRAESELQIEIADLVAAKINKLSAETGLDIHGIDINVADVTTCSSESREYVISNVVICTALPEVIRT